MGSEKRMILQLLQYVMVFSLFVEAFVFLHFQMSLLVIADCLPLRVSSLSKPSKVLLRTQGHIEACIPYIQDV